jgi:hypothetical protein
MNQLTTTNQFKLEETLMQRVFESFGYQFTIVTPNNSEPHFIAKEVADALGYAKTHTLTHQMDDVIKLTKSNGLGFLIEILACPKKGQASTIWDGKDLDRISQLSLIPESSLLKYLLTSATKPKAKVVSEKLYQALIQGKVIFSIKDELDEFDDKDRMLMKLAKTHPEVLQSSKDINTLFHSFIEFNPGYFNWNPSFRKESVYG